MGLSNPLSQRPRKVDFPTPPGIFHRIAKQIRDDPPEELSAAVGNGVLGLQLLDKFSFVGGHPGKGFGDDLSKVVRFFVQGELAILHPTYVQQVADHVVHQFRLLPGSDDQLLAGFFELRYQIVHFDKFQGCNDDFEGIP